MANERLAALRGRMKEQGIDFYYVPSTDFHDSEYVEDYFRCRAYISGFTGSAGTLLVSGTFSGLWTDGRYFVQAAKQLKGQDTELMRMGDEGVPTVEQYLEREFPEGGVLGLDGRVVNAEIGKRLKAIVEKKGGSLKTQYDLAGEIWTDRPEFPAPPIWVLPVEYAGETYESKLSRLREKMEERGATAHVLSSLDDIAWLFNIRKGGLDKEGKETNFLPLAHAMITKTEVKLFLDKAAVPAEAAAYLKENKVALRDYGQIYEEVKKLSGETVLLESGKVNFALFGSVNETNRIVDAMNPTSLMKAAKNPVEVENMRRCHIKDGVAVTKYLFWLKDQAKKGLTETEAAEHLERLRREQKGYLGFSFATISAYGPNAAMCHYRAEKGAEAVIKPEGLYLVDSGGQYYEGTTDVTRTIAMGPVTDEMKRHCTLVLMAMLRLSAAKFLYGCDGKNIDYAARGILWQHGLDFNHGTGHGVAYLSNVHERPNAIRWRWLGSQPEPWVFEEGMVVSDEPGVYLEGQYGIRTENLLVCQKEEKNDFGQFMGFETLTFVPIDMETIDPAILEPSDLQLLNAYHKEVFEKLSPYFEGDERERLYEATKPLLK